MTQRNVNFAHHGFNISEVQQIAGLAQTDVGIMVRFLDGHPIRPATRSRIERAIVALIMNSPSWVRPETKEIINRIMKNNS